MNILKKAIYVIGAVVSENLTPRSAAILRVDDGCVHEFNQQPVACHEH